MLLGFEGSSKTEMESLMKLAPCKADPCWKVDLLLPRQPGQHSAVQQHLQGKVKTPSTQEDGHSFAATSLALQVCGHRLHTPSHNRYLFHCTSKA